MSNVEAVLRGGFGALVLATPPSIVLGASHSGRDGTGANIRTLVAAAAIVAAGISIGGTAFAGEGTGGGKGGPNGDGKTGA
jgi:hypothetical protein